MLIEECMRRSGVAESGKRTYEAAICNPCGWLKWDIVTELEKAMPTLGPSLIQRFESRQGYRTFEDVEPCRKSIMSRRHRKTRC